MKSKAEQKASLQSLARFAVNSVAGRCNFGAMLFMESVCNVSFLAPIAPELRGVEIVSAVGEEFDIWKYGDLLKTNLSASEVVQWLQYSCQHSESDYMAHAVGWIEETLEYFGVQSKEEK